MGRKTRRRPGQAKKGSGGGIVKRELRVIVDALEIAKGYDGPFRGNPEPALLVAAFAKELGGVGAPPSSIPPARLLARSLIRFPVDAKMPCTCVPTEGAALHAKVSTPARVLLLVIAFEEDAGDDLSTSYARCEDLRAMSIWDGLSEIPDPCAIADAFDGASWDALVAEAPADAAEMTAVRIVAAGKDLGDACQRDDYIGAVAHRLEMRAAAERALRARVLSADGRNDWTALLRVTTR